MRMKHAAIGVMGLALFAGVAQGAAYTWVSYMGSLTGDYDDGAHWACSGFCADWPNSTSADASVSGGAFTISLTVNADLDDFVIDPDGDLYLDGEGTTHTIEAETLTISSTYGGAVWLSDKGVIKTVDH